MFITFIYTKLKNISRSTRNILSQLVNYAAMSIISIKNLKKSFGRKMILRNMNLDVKKGEFIVLFGPNGAGKTTLIKILSTLARPTSGDVTINGFNIYEESIDVRRSIGVLSHNPLL